MKERTGAREGDTRPFFLVPTTSKRLLRRQTDSSPGAPNEGMFPRTPEVSYSGFHCALEACLVNLELPSKLFICLDVLGELWSSRKFLVAFFVSSKIIK